MYFISPLVIKVCPWVLRNNSQAMVLGVSDKYYDPESVLNSFTKPVTHTEDY